MADSKILETLNRSESQVLIILQFPNQGVLQGEAAIPTTLAVKAHLDTPVHQLPGYFRKAAMRRLSRTGPLTKQLRKRKQILVLSSSISVPKCSWKKIALDETCRVTTIGDFYEKPSSPSRKVLHAQVVFNVEHSHNTSASTELSDLIQLPKRPSKAKRCLRVGNHPILDGYNSDPEPQSKRVGQSPDAPAYSWPLLVWLDDGYKFTRTHAYEFDDFCIGDAEESGKWNSLPFSNTHYFFGPFEHVHWKREGRPKFISRLKEHMKDEEHTLKTGTPFLPTLCFNDFVPGKDGLGLEVWPKRGVDVAVRCVNHYEPRASLRDLKFPRDIRLFITKEDDIPAICEFISEEINERTGPDGEAITSARLFKPQHRDQWKIELWVMPQTGPRKLYRYENGEVIQFLNATDQVRTKDKKLYMEAHIVRKD